MYSAIFIGHDHHNAPHAWVNAYTAASQLGDLKPHESRVVYPEMWESVPPPKQCDLVWVSCEAETPDMLVVGSGLATGIVTATDIASYAADDGWVIYDCCLAGAAFRDRGRVNAIGTRGYNPNDPDLKASVVAHAIIPLLCKVPMHMITPLANRVLAEWKRKNSWLDDLELITGRIG